MDTIKNKYDFVVLYDVTDGNPNGDPDAGNMPRIDPETGHGLVTDACIKRKIRNYVESVKAGEDGYRIYIKGDKPLNCKDNEALNSQGITKDNITAKKKNISNIDELVRDFMCQQFFDIRTFGAVMTGFTKDPYRLNCGQVRGPVQIGFSRSIDPIMPQEVTITRSAVTTEADAETKNNTMGKKYIVPYALYQVQGHISANLAEKLTGFSEEDLQLLFDAILHMFDDDHSAARGEMVVRKLIIFKHSSKHGSAPVHELFDRIEVKKKEDVTVPRSYRDYNVNINLENLPAGVTAEVRE